MVITLARLLEMPDAERVDALGWLRTEKRCAEGEAREEYKRASAAREKAQAHDHAARAAKERAETLDGILVGFEARTKPPIQIPGGAL